jgi:membrane-associated phospholipid phosphatase
VLLWLAVTAALAIVAYFFVDRPVTFFVRDAGLKSIRLLKWLTRPPEAFVILSPFVLLAGLLRRWFGPWTRSEKVAVVAAVSTVCTAGAAGLLKMTFGRYCPDGAEGVPSLLHGGAYGFEPFHAGAAYWAFPSGHTACTVSVLAVVGAAIPRWRLVCWTASATVAAALVALNYHFVGDVVAGAWLGWAVGGTAARLFGIDSRGCQTSDTIDPADQATDRGARTERAR